MTRTTYSFLAVLALALATVALGSPPDGSALIWSGYGVQANIPAAGVAVGAHLVLATLVYRLWNGLGQGRRVAAVRPQRLVPRVPPADSPRIPAHGADPDAPPDVALIGLRGLTARAAERGDLGTARELARRGLADSPGTGWLEELLDKPKASPSKASGNEGLA